MKHKYHNELKSQLRFAYTPGGGCDCKDYYSLQFDSKSTAIIRKEKCKNGRPANKCNWEMVKVKMGLQIEKTNELNDMSKIKNIIELWGLMR